MASTSNAYTKKIKEPLCAYAHRPIGRLLRKNILCLLHPFRDLCNFIKAVVCSQFDG